MASNPMQRRARNSFLLGVVITLVIIAIIGALLYLLVLKDELATETGSGVVAYVYKLKEGINVDSGKSITAEMVEEVKLTADVVPTDAIMSKYKTESGELQNIAFPAGQKSKIALKSGTVLGASMLYTDDLTDNSLRLVEFNMITLPSTIYVGEYIDVRLFTPTGEDYIVLTKKCVASIKGETIGLYLTEAEILTMSGAIVDAYTMTASNIYAIKYVEPGMQSKAEQTYMVKQSILELMTQNPNIVAEASSALANRWNSGGSNTRIDIENSLSIYQESGLMNVEEKMQEQIEEARELYLSGLEGY